MSPHSMCVCVCAQTTTVFPMTGEHLACATGDVVAFDYNREVLTDLLPTH